MRTVLLGLSLAIGVAVEMYAASPLKLFVSIAQKVAPVYVAPPKPPADFLVFVNEPLMIQVDVLNDSEMPKALIARDRRVGITVRTFPDRIALNVPIRMPASPVRVFGTGESPVTWDERMPLAARERLKWTADVSIDSVPPGIYSIDSTLPGNDDEGSPIVNQVPRVVVEVRDNRSEGAAEEIALRAASRFLVTDRLVEAVEAASAMVAQYPNSAAGYAVLGDAYAALRNAEGAADSYSRAAMILETNSDDRLNRRTPEQLREMLFILRSKIARWR